MQHTKLARIAGVLLTIIAFQAIAAAEPEVTPAPATMTSPTPAPTPAPAPVVVTAPAVIPQPINPLLNPAQLPNFLNTKLSDFDPAMTMAIQDCNNILNTILKAPPSWNNTIQPLEEQISRITSIWNLLNIFNNYAQTTQTQDTYNTVLTKLSTFHGNLMQNKDLYKAYLTIKNSADFAKLSATQQVTINQTILNFKLNGADLNAIQQKSYTQIVQRLRELANQFNNNLSAATNSWQYYIQPQDAKRLDGLPDFTKNNAANKAKSQGKDGWVLTLDDACLVAVESYAKDRKLRETLYTAYATLASAQDPDPSRKQWDNTAIVAETLNLRLELATLLGYTDYAAYAIADRQPPNPEQAMQFLQDLAAKTMPAAQQDLTQLLEFAKQDKIDSLQAWDIAYYAQWRRAMLAGNSQAQSKEYFQTQAVIKSMFNLASIIFNIDFKEIKDASTWNEQVKLYQILDAQNKPLAYFYLDPYARADKTPYDTTDMYMTRLHAKTDLLPVAVMSTNIAEYRTGLLSLTEVVSLFQQFGAMLQRTIATLDYPGLSGTSDMTWDAIQLSNQFMQTWVWQKEFVRDISKHYKTGTPLPDDLFTQLVAVNNFNAGLDLLQQLQLAIFDLRIHLNAQADKGKTALEIFNEIRKQYNVIPAYNKDILPNRFSQTFTTEFAATYYCYYWANSLASDAFAAFKESGLFTAKIGHKYRDTILMQGGQASIQDLFQKFRGRTPEIKFFLIQQSIITG